MKNILMDANSLFPRGFHPVDPMLLPDVSDEAPCLPRSQGKIRYYYVDFGISSHISPNSSDKLVLGRDGLDRDVPELSQTAPYDPFKVDVFILGNLFGKELEQVCSLPVTADSVP